MCLEVHMSLCLTNCREWTIMSTCKNIILHICLQITNTILEEMIIKNELFLRKISWENLK